MVMGGRRVFVSGVGGELGTLVASLLEAEEWVGALSGIDRDPPRRRLHRTEFHRIHPDHHDRIVDTVVQFNPHILIHVGVWEPDARAATREALTLTDQAATSIIGAAAECPALEHLVVRSGIEIYGRGRGSLTRPSETAPLQPTSEWGRTVAAIEHTAVAGRRASRRHGRCAASRSRPRAPCSFATRSPPAHAGGAVQRARRSALRRDRGP